MANKSKDMTGVITHKMAWIILIIILTLAILFSAGIFNSIPLVNPLLKNEDNCTITCVDNTCELLRDIILSNLTENHLIASRNPSISEAMMSYLVTYKDKGVNAELLDNPSITPKILQEISETMAYKDIILKVMKHDKTEDRTLIYIWENRINPTYKEEFQKCVSECSWSWKTVIPYIRLVDGQEFPKSGLDTIPCAWDDELIDEFLRQISDKTKCDKYIREVISEGPERAKATFAKDNRTPKDVLEVLIYSDNQTVINAILQNEALLSDECLYEQFKKQHHDIPGLKLITVDLVKSEYTVVVSEKTNLRLIDTFDGRFVYTLKIYSIDGDGNIWHECPPWLSCPQCSYTKIENLNMKKLWNRDERIRAIQNIGLSPSYLLDWINEE
jgi:hypothetical protein